VGARPVGVAFDGANIWVANFESSSVSKLRASDGKTLGTFNVGGSPYGVAFDGNSIWVTGSPFVWQLRPSDGKLVGEFALNDDTSGIAFDGANIWVAGFFKNDVSKL
jgi:DNA-binding beta-propeller fold protein YncE